MKVQSNLFRIGKPFLTVLILILFVSLTQAQNFTNFTSMSNSPAGSSGVSWILGGKVGMSIGSASGGSSVGLLIGPMGEVLFGKGMAVGTELNINTQSGTPIEWADYFKYYFNIPGSSIKPYANFGLSLWFVTGGPYFGIRFGGGANFKVANNLYIPADLQLGPVFVSQSNGFGQSTSTTVFYIAITSGIRYELP